MGYQQQQMPVEVGQPVVGAPIGRPVAGLPTEKVEDAVGGGGLIEVDPDVDTAKHN